MFKLKKNRRLLVSWKWSTDEHQRVYKFLNSVFCVYPESILFLETNLISLQALESLFLYVFFQRGRLRIKLMKLWEWFECGTRYFYVKWVWAMIQVRILHLKWRWGRYVTGDVFLNWCILFDVLLFLCLICLNWWSFSINRAELVVKLWFWRGYSSRIVRLSRAASLVDVYILLEKIEWISKSLSSSVTMGKWLNFKRTRLIGSEVVVSITGFYIV